MDPAMFAVLFSATAINAAVPGPCTILTASRSGVAGQVAGIQITVGVLLANLVLVTITLAVMHGALTVSDQAFGAMKWASALQPSWLSSPPCCPARPSRNSVRSP